MLFLDSIRLFHWAIHTAHPYWTPLKAYACEGKLVLRQLGQFFGRGHHGCSRELIAIRAEDRVVEAQLLVTGEHGAFSVLTLRSIFKFNICISVSVSLFSTTALLGAIHQPLRLQLIHGKCVEIEATNGQAILTH